MWPFMASFLPFRYMAQEYNTAQKIKFFTDDFFRKCDQIRRKLVTFTKEILYGKLNFLCTVRASTHINLYPAGKKNILTRYISAKCSILDVSQVSNSRVVCAVLLLIQGKVFPGVLSVYRNETLGRIG